MSTSHPGSHVERDDPEGLLNPRTGPASAAFATLVSEAGSDLNWFFLRDVPRDTALRGH